MKRVIHPVELLRDSKGVYGIGIAKEAEIERPPQSIILRPDRIDADEVEFSHGPIYQMITGGFRHGMFCHTPEEHLRQEIHYEMLRRAGLPWPPPPTGDVGPYVDYWSTDKEQQTRNRQIFHGLRLGSLAIINKLIREALEEAAVPEAAKQARRFRFLYRSHIYQAGATSLRALQLIETFPVLALKIYDRSWGSGQQSQYKNREAKTLQADEARALVERGVPLKQVASLMGVPMAMRKVKPGAADTALRSFLHCPWDCRLTESYMPGSLPRMKVWLRAICFASDLGPDFVEWTAKHVLELEGAATEALSFLSDTGDWVQACYRASTPPHIHRAILGDRHEVHDSRGEEFVTRPFSPDMSLRTVMRLSGEWHEAVAENMAGPSYEFPQPWCGAGTVDKYEIRPITNSADLYREGHAMHHCAGTLAGDVRSGRAYIYSVRERGDRVATAEIVKTGDQPSLGQLRGPCNSLVPKKIERAVVKWLRSQKEFCFPAPPVNPIQEFPFSVRADAMLDDAGIPF